VRNRVCFLGKGVHAGGGKDWGGAFRSTQSPVLVFEKKIKRKRTAKQERKIAQTRNSATVNEWGSIRVEREMKRGASPTGRCLRWGKNWTKEGRGR